jgi:MFS family permease
VARQRIDLLSVPEGHLRKPLQERSEIDVVTKPTRAPVTYRALFGLPGLPRLAGATVVARTGASMQALVLVLFVLQRFQSPPLAGLVVFLSLVPGLVVSPVAGALLDRHQRMLLIRLDYAIGATALGLLALLDSLGRLPVPILLLIVGVGSLTNPLSNSGTRSLFPVMVPRVLWGRVNAIDSGAYVVASIAGPALAGVLVGAASAEAALLATAVLYIGAFMLLLSMTEPAIERIATGSLVRDALAGVGYVLRHRELRGIAVATSVTNIGFGILTVGMPVLLLSQLNAGAASVGVMYAIMGLAGLVASVVAGRIPSERREVWFVFVGCCLSGLAMAAMLIAAGVGGGLVLVGVAMAIFGVSQGPYDIGMFSLRQRVTAPAWMGRAFAVSMSLNFIGMPIGSALAGPVVGHSLPTAFIAAVLVNVVAGAAALLMLRNRAAPSPAVPAAANDRRHDEQPFPD